MKKNCLILAGPLIAALTILLHASAPARAELRIDITRGKVEPVPIAIRRSRAAPRMRARRDKI